MNDTLLNNLDLSQIQAERCRRSFYIFFKEFWDVIIPEELVDNWHIKFLCDELQLIGEKIVNREPKDYDLVINISPGSTKSTIASVMFPAWLWARDSTIRTIAGSHASGLSIDLSVKSRDIIQSDKYKKYFNVTLKEDQNNKSSFKTESGGSRVATSVGSSAIGQHAHCIIVDDPCKVNPSDAEIKAANEWITNELATRKIDKMNTPTILIMQRLAENDPTAHVLQKVKKVKHICLPAELTDDIQPKEAKTYYKNGLMDVDRLNRDVLNDMKERLGSFGYASQFLQTPQPSEGGIIKMDWIQTIDRKEVAEDLASTPPHFFLDTAYTDDEGNDPTAIVVARKKGNLMYVEDAQEIWMEFPDLIKWLERYFGKMGYDNRFSKIYIEPKASGKSIAQYLKKQTQFNVVEDKSPSESKETRLKAIAPKLEAQKVYLLKGGWNDNFIQQLTHAKPAHDDMRDAFVMGVNKLLITGIGRRAWR